MMTLARRGSLLSLMLILSQAGSAQPQAGAADGRMSLVALRQLETGLWQLDVKGKAPRLVCVADPAALVQVEHDQAGCSRFVVANEPRSSTVHYSCQKAGWGRTTIRVETPRLAAIHTQGISHNAPFDYTVEARRVAGCTAQSASRQR